MHPNSSDTGTKIYWNIIEYIYSKKSPLNSITASRQLQNPQGFLMVSLCEVVNSPVMSTFTKSLMFGSCWFLAQIRLTITNHEYINMGKKGHFMRDDVGEHFWQSTLSFHTHVEWHNALLPDADTSCRRPLVPGQH